ncbi:MAG TPA: V-type ATP synthase subunit A [Clostridiales bacterium]|nr:V-type ATP synthase subunit A [Clostridiales bacterium]
MGKVVKVSGPLVVATGLSDANMSDVVRVGPERLIGEILTMNGDSASIQVYEETSGLGPGAEVVTTGYPMSVELGPGMIENIYDGIQRPLEEIMKKVQGNSLPRGVEVPPIDPEKKWEFTPVAAAGQQVSGGDVIGTVPETPVVLHKIMVPPYLKGTLKSVADKGSYTVKETVAVLVKEDGTEVPLTMSQRWPVRTGRPYQHKYSPTRPLSTGQRIVDTFFPVAKGGTAAIPGPFGSGKTVMQHAVAKWSDVDIVIYIGCGERGNEMTDVLREFPELIDPRTGRSLMERTTIVCNTSNMPVAAREASVYTAMTICEYYRAMGLKVLLLADSTSRWAQALREMSNRMEELPGADAFPVDLSSIISNFYARAGAVVLNNGQTGSVTFIGTVSPAGGNLKEPVTESTKKAARCFYALSQNRADKKRYPAVDPIDSYSKYLEYPEIVTFLKEKISPRWVDMVLEAKNLVLRGKEAFEQINILGDDGVPVSYHERYWKSELIDYIILQQDAFDRIDASTPLERQEFMLEKVLDVCHAEHDFETFEECSTWYKEVINLFRQMNYSEFRSDDFNRYLEQINKYISHDK